MGQPDWQKDKYLKTPEHFSDTVDACVRRQLAKPAAEPEAHMRLSVNTNNESRGDTMMGSNKRPFKAFGWRKAVACAAALVIVIGGSAWAATQFQLEKYLGRDAGSDAQAVEEHIEVIDETVESGQGQVIEADLPELLRQFKQDTDEMFMEPLVQLKEVYFDGAVLHVYGEATDAGKDYWLATSRVFVNNEQYVGEIMRMDNENLEADKYDPDAYHGRIQLSEAQITGDFTVQIPFEVYKRDDISKRLGFQTVSVKVSVSDNTADVIDVGAIRIENGTVDVTTLTLTPSTMHICYTWRLTGDTAETDIQALADSGFAAKDNLGNTYDSMLDSNEGGSVTSEVYQDESGAWCTDKEYYITGVPTDITSLTITPYSFKSLDEVLMDLSKDEDLLFGEFTIQIK